MPSLEQLANVQPISALLLAEGADPLPTLVPVDIAFTNDGSGLSAGSTVEASFPDLLGAPFIVDSIVATVEQPNFLAGSALKAQADYYQTFSPYISVSSRVIGNRLIPKYAIETRSTSLANFVATFRESWPGGWILPAATQLVLKATLTRNLVPDQDPFIVRLAFRGWTATGLSTATEHRVLTLGHAEASARCLAGLSALREGRPWPTIAEK